MVTDINMSELPPVQMFTGSFSKTMSNYVTWLPVSSKAVTVWPFILIFSSLALPISLAHGSGFKNFEEGLFLAISFSTILVDLEEMVGEWLGEVGLFKHSSL